MGAQWLASDGAGARWTLAVGGLLGGLALVYFLPLVLIPEDSLLLDEPRLKAESDLRQTLVQAIGGAILLVGTGLTLHINREGQITERFTRAIEHLGHAEDKLDIRLGGIYALQRIARESRRDRGPIVAVLTAYLRGHAQWNVDPPHAASDTAAEPGSGNVEPPRLRADFQAVATVLSGKERWSRQHPFDLDGVALQRAVLVDAHLEGAHLNGAHLERANLTGAHLEGAWLEGAHLEGARLDGADLKGAHLRDAYLQGTYLHGAQLVGAQLMGAKLMGAQLMGDLKGGPPANLKNANLSRADLSGAILGDADLEGADLTGAKLEGTNRAQG